MDRDFETVLASLIMGKFVNYQVSVVSSLYVITGETCYLR